MYVINLFFVFWYRRCICIFERNMLYTQNYYPDNHKIWPICYFDTKVALNISNPPYNKMNICQNMIFFESVPKGTNMIFIHTSIFKLHQHNGHDYIWFIMDKFMII